MKVPILTIHVSLFTASTAKKRRESLSAV